MVSSARTLIAEHIAPSWPQQLLQQPRPVAQFTPAAGLGAAQVQTLLGITLRPLFAPRTVRERWDTPDGDFIDVDILEAATGAPWVLVLHGLEGSSRSGYVNAVLRNAAARGWGAMALNFRTCGGEPNRLLRFYHGGDTDDARLVLERMQRRTSGPLFAAGFSLGGSVLLRLLSELGSHSPLRAAVTMSVPYDLELTANTVDGKGLWMLAYRACFVAMLRSKAIKKARRHGGKLDERRIRAARSVHTFDDAFTAPANGFANAKDYYRRSSASACLAGVATETLLISSLDDPMSPGLGVPQSATKNAALSSLVTAHGGHLGFIAGSLARPRFWADEQMMTFFAQRT